MKDLARTAVHGARWTGAATVMQIVVRMAQTAILARLLTPGEFGLFGMTMTLVGLALVLTEMGVGGAVIPRGEVDEQRLSTIYWTNIGVGVVAFAAVALLSPGVAWFYGRDELVGLTLAVGVNLLIWPIGSLQRILVQKQLRFRALGLIEVSVEIIGVVAAVVAALAGLGIYSFAIGMVARSVPNAALQIAACRSWRPSLHWRRADLDGYLSFGLYQVGGRCLTFVTNTADKVLIGRILGEDALGYYQVAWNLMLRPMRAVGQVVHRVALPLFAQIRHEKPRLGSAYLQLLHTVAFFAFPVYFGLLAIAGPFVEVYLGPGWESAVPVLQILVMLGLLHVVGNPLGSLLNALERANVEFYMNVCVLAVTLPVVWYASRWGVEGIAMSLLIVELLFFYPLEAAIRRALVGLSFFSGVRAVVRPLLLSAVMAAVVAGLDDATGITSVQWRISALMATGVVTYTILGLLFERRLLTGLRGRAS